MESLGNLPFILLGISVIVTVVITGIIILKELKDIDRRRETVINEMLNAVEDGRVTVAMANLGYQYSGRYTFLDRIVSSYIKELGNGVFIQIYFDVHPDGWFCVTVHDSRMCNWVTSEFDTEYEYESDDESLEGDIEDAVSKVLEKYKERVK